MKDVLIRARESLNAHFAAKSYGCDTPYPEKLIQDLFTEIQHLRYDTGMDETDWRDIGEAAHHFAQGWPTGGEMWKRFRTLAEKAWRIAGRTDTEANT